jgi:tetratricopeptide (TPR) repeat protein
MITLLALLGLAQAQNPVPSPGPSPGPSPVQPAALSDAQRGAEFTTWAMAMAQGNRDAALAALVTLIDDPAKAAVHGEAWAHLGEVYADMNLPLAALGALGKGISLDPTHTAAQVPRALELVEEVHEGGLVAKALGNNLGIQVDPKVRNQLSAVAARQQIEAGSYQAAIAILMMADKDQPGFEDVELLRGVALSQQDQHSNAVAPLLTAAALAVQNKRDQRYIDTVNLNVARTYYSAGNYGQAISWYAKVSRGSDYWIEAQFERAWAHFRGNDMNGALSMLFNHDSPFFEDFFWPEVDLLRSYSLFVMCKFKDATVEMDQFAAKYEPIGQELAGLSLSPAEAFEDVRAFRADEPTTIPNYVLRPFRHEKRLDDALAAVDQADEELRKTDKLEGRAAEIATQLITEQRDARIQTEGKRVLARVETARAELASMLEGMEITRLDLLNLETEMYERAAATGVLEYGNHIEQLRQMRKEKRGFRVWPWQGEYWADELGWFVFSARPDCPESMARGDLAP